MERKKTPDMKELLTGTPSTEGVQNDYGENTGETQQKHRENTDITRLKEYGDKARGTFSIRIDDRDRESLQRYFENRGLKLTQGIRMIIKEYMERQGI